MYKGGIPARYGGKLSSVLDISMKAAEEMEQVEYGNTSVTLENDEKKITFTRYDGGLKKTVNG